MTLNLARLHEYEVVAPDVETTGLHWYRGDKMFGVAIAAMDEDGRVEADYFDIREKPRVVELLKSEFSRCKRIVNHNIKFDAHMLREAGCPLPLDKIECTSVRAALINEHEPHFNLDALGMKYVQSGKMDIWADMAALFGGEATRAVQIKNLHRAPVALAAKYATPDSVIALRLWAWQEEHMQDLQEVWGLERQMTAVLVEVEQHGVRVDTEYAAKSIIKMDGMIAEAQQALNYAVGKAVNVNSSPQMHALFGVDSVTKEFLRHESAKGDKNADMVLAVRRYVKGKSFLKDHVLGHAVNGRVHPNYNQTRGGDNELGTGTGRFSIDDPALQQIPIRDRDIAAIVRPAFIPDVGESWVRSDWDQFEFRWFAHYLEDPKISQMYLDDPDSDFHQVVADLTGIPRDPEYAGGPAAKRINLGLVFGMGAGKMAAEMRMDYTTDERGYLKPGPKAQELFDRYHSAVPGIKSLLAKASSLASSRGYVRTIAGRRIRFPFRSGFHKAGGLVFQGSSADCMKLKMIESHRHFKKEGGHLLLSVHDETDSSVPKGAAKHEAKLLKQRMEDFGPDSPIKCDIPIRCSVSVGKDWWECSK